MKRLVLVALLSTLPLLNFAQTTIVRAHDHTDMTWYGAYDKWAEFPDGSQAYRKIILHYDMGCATGGCSPWDYTTTVELRHRTGNQDSTLTQQPSFTVDGNEISTYYFNLNTTYTTYYNSTTLVTDSTANTPVTIIVYGDPQNPTNPTDTLIAWEANYWNYEYNNAGAVIDSQLVVADSTWNLTHYNYYNVFDEIQSFELARVITPYGGNLPQSFSFTHDFDVTDFAHLLKDSVEIRVFYSGWSSGFSATLDFEFFQGTPPREVIRIDPVYSGGSGYPNSNSFETSFLYPKNIYITPSTQGAKLRMTATGHGFDNNVTAAEFLPITYSVKVDGAQTHSQYNWRGDCGLNPIYPDYETSTAYVHTWLYDRANWCPGLKAHSHEHEISNYITPNDSVNINIDFPNYTWTGNQEPSYIIECQLVQYGAPNFTNDAELVRIMAPSDEDEFARLNPICVEPRVIIRNYGSTALTSCDIEYHIDGGPVETFRWTGNLAFMDTAEVELPLANPIAFWISTTGQWKFYAEVKNPNGTTDQYAANNTLISEYKDVPVYPATFIVNFKTNNAASENSYTITDQSGTVVWQRSGLSNNTTYSDTLALAEGCYVFDLVDTGGDGLAFYYNNSGTGYCRFRIPGGSIIRTFKPNFGSGYTEHFKVGYLFSTPEQPNQQDLAIYPNPSNGNFTIDLAGIQPGEVNVEIFSLIGERIYQRSFESNGTDLLTQIDLQGTAPGVYFVRLTIKGVQETRRIVVAGY